MDKDLKKTIKISCPKTWNIEIMKNQIPDYVLKKYNIYFNKKEKECDYWIVFGYLEHEEKSFVSPLNTILITFEPESVKKYSHRFLKQFNTIISSQEIDHRNLIKTATATFWPSNYTHSQLLNLPTPKKTKKLVIITSNKKTTKGHEKRLKFALKLKKMFNNEIDIFGKGINSFDNKLDLLTSYKYSICIENSSYNDYWTEKISDCFLAYTVPIYFGCKNIYNYYPQNSIIDIDINNFKKSVKIIKNILENDNDYYTRLPKIKEAREIFLNKYHIFNLIFNIIDKRTNVKEKKEIILVPENNVIKKINIIINKIKYGK